MTVRETNHMVNRLHPGDKINDNANSRARVRFQVDVMNSKNRSKKKKKPVYVDAGNSPIFTSEGSQDSIQKVNLEEV